MYASQVMPGDRIVIGGTVRTVTSNVRGTERGEWFARVAHVHPRDVNDPTAVARAMVETLPADDVVHRATVTTWADGFGNWHASVPLGASRQAEAREARRAIIAELSERYADYDARTLHVHRAGLPTNHGTVTYSEGRRFRRHA